MSIWPRDNEAALKAFYGNPETGEVERQLVKVVPPFQMYYAGKPVKSLLIHKKAASAFMAMFNAIWEASGRDQAKLDKLRVSHTAGTYNKRKIANSNRWSNHAFGAAWDVDAEHNGFNTGRGTIPQFVIDAAYAQGFRWGGDYTGRTDPMHFEACWDGKPQPVRFIGGATEDDFVFEPYNGEDHIKGLLFEDSEPVDDHSDEGEQEAQSENQPGFFRRWRKRIFGTAGGATGLGFLGYMTDWQVVLVLCAFALVVIVAGVWFAIKFMGADTVRAWIKKAFQ